MNRIVRECVCACVCADVEAAREAIRVFANVLTWKRNVKPKEQ